MASERLKGKEQFHFKYCLLKCLIEMPFEMPHSHPKMRLKNAPQKMGFVMVKVISKSYTLD